MLRAGAKLALALAAVALAGRRAQAAALTFRERACAEGQRACAASPFDLPFPDCFRRGRHPVRIVRGVSARGWIFCDFESASCVLCGTKTRRAEISRK